MLTAFSYIYDATGRKVRKVVRIHVLSQNTVTDYAHGFQYLDHVIQHFPTAEGYVSRLNLRQENGVVALLPSTELPVDFFTYVYNYTDHLGNIRLSYAQDPDTQQLKIVEQNHYYPFGLRHTNYSGGKMQVVKEQEFKRMAPTPEELLSYKYKYNGKEYQDELGLNLYDYGARLYDPAAPHFLQIDPKAETSRRFSPYTYCLNNPVFFIDPDGMQAIASDNDDWVVYQGQSGQTQVIYDEGVKTRAEAEAKYNNVSDFFKSGSISGTDQNNTSYSYKLNDGGTVTDTNTNATVETGFTTPNGTYVGENKSTLSQLAPVLSNSGDAAVILGTVMVCSGVGAPVGAGLITYGGYASTTGTVMDLANDVNNGNLTAEKVATKAAMAAIPEFGNAAFKALGEPAAGAVINSATIGADRFTDELRDAKAGPYKEY